MPEPIDLTMCADCAQIYANGIDEHSDEQKSHAHTMLMHTEDWRGQIAVGEHTDEFSARRCDTCGTDTCGDRYSGVLFGTMGGA